MQQHTGLGVEQLRARTAAPQTNDVRAPGSPTVLCYTVLLLLRTDIIRLQHDGRHAAMETQITRTCTVLVCGAYMVFGPRPRDHDRVWSKRGAVWAFAASANVAREKKKKDADVATALETLAAKRKGRSLPSFFSSSVQYPHNPHSNTIRGLPKPAHHHHHHHILLLPSLLSPPPRTARRRSRLGSPKKETNKRYVAGG